MLHLQIHKIPTAVVAEFRADHVLLASAADARDLLMQARGERADVIALHVENIAPEFFDLRTGVAGAVLQKFQNYRCRFAIIGDISNYTSKSEALRALVRESNRGKDVWFVPTVDAMLNHGW
ncbi:MAG TPA: DUF4180 domain-containing protein [Rhizomicrobium sp.]|nr:DUF4180 domain-containing protein [Rhizomicrobium sp.]